MLITLTITTAFLTIYYLYLMATYQWAGWYCTFNRYSQCSNAFFPNLPAFFLALAVILNVNKWIYFLLRVLAYVNIGKRASKKFDAAAAEREVR